MEKEFITYLKENQGFERFMELWKQRYITLGKLGGSIVITDPSIVEKKAISLLLGMYFENSIKITYTKMMKQLQITKFHDIDFLKVLELYFNQKIITKKEIKENKDKQFEKDREALVLQYQNTKANEWLQYCNTEDYTLFKKIIHVYQIDKSLVVKVLEAINALPLWTQEVKSFSIFSNEITNNPHFFDKGIANSLLFQAVSYYLGYQKESFSLLNKNRIWSEVGLMKEQDMNYCMVYGLYAKTINNIEHTGLEYFSKQSESLNLHVDNIQQIQSFHSVDAIFIVENPSVFRYLIATIKSNSKYRYGCICTNGELNYSAYLLLDIIYASHIKMYYCGDFDPEGVLIADKIKQKYGDAVTLWHYQKEDYFITNPTKLIEPYRLQKLKHCKHKDLEAIKTLLLQNKKAGYQEALINIYKEDIVEYHKKNRYLF